MIDISHSMILYGEDRITPAKKVAMALAELITTRYPKDTIDILVFGNDAWSISIKDIPYLKVGPYHTNTVAGLQLAMDILRRKRNTNKQIFMITDGKPSCLRLPDGQYYKNSNGLDDYIVDKCYTMAAQARKMHIPITTFMIAQDPYLQHFVDEFTKSNKGKAFFTGLKGLGEMIFHDYADIGIAVSSPKGLMVPVVRNAEQMSLADIEREIKRLAIKARDGKITPEDMSGGTFTITNGGVFGSMLSTPIINPPQSAILGMHNVVERPVAINGKVEIRPIMYVALSYDHRIIDGKESVGFLVKVKEMLENPERMIFGSKDPMEILLGL